MRSIYAVIPASVRYDTSLRPNAKLLYGELSALAVAEGYCWASNAYLGDLFGLSKRSIEGLLKELKDRGHIEISTERDPQTHEVLSRKIWIAGPVGLQAPPPRKIAGRSPQKRGDPPRQICAALYVDNNNIIPPIVPQGDDGACDGDVGKSVPKWNPRAFEEFWQIYRTRCRGENRKGACRAWDKLKPTPELLVRIYTALGQQLASEDWKRGIGIPYCSTYLNGRRWEDVEDDSQPVGNDDPQGEEAQDGWE